MKSIHRRERRELAVKRVNRLIADAEESASFRRYVVPDARLRENRELAEICRGLYSRDGFASTPDPKTAT